MFCFRVVKNMKSIQNARMSFPFLSFIFRMSSLKNDNTKKLEHFRKFKVTNNRT